MRYSSWQWKKFFGQSFPKPANDAELAIVSEIVFGVPLSMEVVGDGSYRVRQPYSIF